MWYSFVLGNRVAWPGFSRTDAILLGIVVLGGQVAQIPLWIAQIVFRWRMTGTANETVPSSEAEKQFSIGHLLLATLLLSVALSPARAVLPPGEFGSLSGYPHYGELLVVLAAVILCNFAVTVRVGCGWASSSRR